MVPWTKKSNPETEQESPGAISKGKDRLPKIYFLWIGWVCGVGDLLGLVPEDQFFVFPCFFGSWKHRIDCRCFQQKS